MALTKKTAPSNSDEWVGFFVANFEQLIDTGHFDPESMMLKRIADAIKESGSTSDVLTGLLDKIRRLR